MAIPVQKDRTVVLAYRLMDGEGRLLEERTPEHPLEFVQGYGEIVPPVERIIEGKTAGFRAEVTVSPREAYGEYNAALVAELPRSHFSSEHDVKVGMKFNTVDASGKPVTVRVIECDEEMVTVDGNHPLAGLELRFELRILDVREEGDQGNRLH